MIKETTIINAGTDRPTIYFLKGLPASGKSTWAIANGENLNAVRINKDALRAMMNLPFTKENERSVVHASREFGKESLRNGLNVIVDDTNFASKHLNAWKNIAEDKSIMANLIEVYFDVPLKTCVNRDANRTNPVGEQVILKIWDQMTGGTVTDPREYVEQDNNLPTAVIVDIDGTMSLADGRNIFDNTLIHTDRVNHPVQWLVSFLEDKGIKIIFLTGREGTHECKVETIKWLDEHADLDSFQLIMRKEGDYRKDSIVKTELYNEYINGKYNIKFWLDDRDSVVNMVRRELKLPCFQVYYGDF
jgi:predicted kinase